MRTRSKRQREESLSSFDIKQLPKEALFNLLLLVQPEEIKTVCKSKNPIVRAICDSRYFQDAYRNKYPKKLIQAPLKTTPREGNMGASSYLEILDKRDNKLVIYYDDSTGELYWIFYIPSRQNYPSTAIKNIDVSKTNPIEISLEKQDDGNFSMTIGRNNLHGIISAVDEDDFLGNYNQEVKEFLVDIERERWWSPDIQFRKNQVSQRVMLDFYDDVIQILKENDLLKIYHPKLE